MARLRRNWLVRTLFYRRRILALLHFTAWFGLLAAMASEYDLASQALHNEAYIAAMWAGISGFGAVLSLFNLMGREERWDASELSLARELAQAGHVVFPAVDGGYDVYGPDGTLLWLDHWWEVEEYATSHCNVSHLPGSGAVN